MRIISKCLIQPGCESRSKKKAICNIKQNTKLQLDIPEQWELKQLQSKCGKIIMSKEETVQRHC